MNNFVFSQDPLLFQSYQQKTISPDEFEAKQRHLNEMITQYNQIQPPQPQHQERDYLGELDSLLKGLRNDIAESISSDTEYMELNQELQSIIQEELMKNIKWKINGNQKAIQNIEQQKNIISRIKNESEEEERKNLNELNDYMKNYSSITFDEYKKLKAKKQ